MAKHRRHSIAFKRQIAQAYLAGETVHGLARDHGLSRSLIRIWVDKFEEGAFDEDAEAADLARDYEAKIAALERLVGRQALECPSKNGGLSEREVCDSPKFGNKRRIAWPGPLSPAWIMTEAGNAVHVIRRIESCIDRPRLPAQPGRGRNRRTELRALADVHSAGIQDRDGGARLFDKLKHSVIPLVTLPSRICGFD